jgi:SAM-dependent methyltransferase
MDIYKLSSDSIIAWQQNDPGNRMTIRLINKILKNQDKESKILDLGCGTGQLAFILGKEGFDVTGADYSPKIVDIANSIAKKSNLNVKFFVADAQKYYKKNAYDVVICSEVLEHLKNDKQVVDNIFKSLKPNGIVILTGPHDMKQWRELDVYHQHYRRYSVNDVKKLLHKFQIEDIFTRGYPTIRIIDILFDKINKLKKKSGVKDIYGGIWKNKNTTFIFSKIIFPVIYYISFIDNMFNHMNKGTNYIAIAKRK